MDTVHQLSCMEIWGGSEAVVAAVAIPGIDAWVYGEPHEGSASGGDVYYASSCVAGIIGRFVLADVAGHGPSAAATAAALRDLMRKNMNTLDQSRFACALNELFAAHTGAGGTFATALLTTYHAPSKHLLVCNAGHPCPLWYQAATQTWKRLEPAAGDVRASAGLGNLPLGIISPTEYSQFAVPLQTGDLIVLYTDALIEAGPDPAKMLGEAGLLALVSSLNASSAEELGRAIIDAVDRHAATESRKDRSDDLTLMVLHHNAAPPPPRSLKDLTRIAARLLGFVPVYTRGNVCL